MRETNTGVYRIADINLRIDTIYPYTQEYCEGYRGNGAPELTIAIRPEDIEREGRASAASEPVLESIAVYRKFAERLPKYGGFVFHGSAVAVDGACFIFTARSGTGKTTHTELWRRLLGERVCVVNGDKPVIRLIHGQPWVYGTPYSGKERYNENLRAPLRAICLLERARENTIREITKSEALPMLIQQTYRPSDPGMLQRTLALLDGLNVKLYRLGCNMDISAAELSYNTMRG